MWTRPECLWHDLDRGGSRPIHVYIYTVCEMLYSILSTGCVHADVTSSDSNRDGDGGTKVPAQRSKQGRSRTQTVWTLKTHKDTGDINNHVWTAAQEEDTLTARDTDTGRQWGGVREGEPPWSTALLNCCQVEFYTKKVKPVSEQKGS